MKVAIYARVSTGEQDPTNQLHELRRYCDARGWTIANEYVDHGVSGARESRPALDDMLREVKRRHVDGVVVWKLDRLGRNLRHLILTLDDLTSVGVAFVSLGEGIDTATASGRLQLHILGAMAEFERGRISERVCLGLARARRQGQRLGRPRRTALPEAAPRGLTVRAAALAWGVSKSTAARRLAAGLAPDSSDPVAAVPAMSEPRDLIAG